MIVSAHRWPLSGSGVIATSEAVKYVNQFKLAIGDLPLFTLNYGSSITWQMAPNDSLKAVTPGDISLAERVNYLSVTSTRSAVGKELIKDIIAQRLGRSGGSGNASPLVIKGSFPSVFSGEGWLSTPVTALTDVFVEVVVNYQANTIGLFYNDTEVYSVGFTGDTLEIAFGTTDQATDGANKPITPWHLSFSGQVVTYFSQSYRAMNFVGDIKETPRLGYVDIANLGLSSTPVLGTDAALTPTNGSSVPIALSDPLTLSNSYLGQPTYGATTSAEYGYISPVGTSFNSNEILSVGCTALASRRDQGVAAALDVVIRKNRGTNVGASGNFPLPSGMSRIPYVICDLITAGESIIADTSYQFISDRFDIGFKSGKIV